jgi:hypothetical protein
VIISDFAFPLLALLLFKFDRIICMVIKNLGSISAIGDDAVVDFMQSEVAFHKNRLVCHKVMLLVC